MNKKTIIITSMVTAVAVFFLTALFFTTSLGAHVFIRIYDSMQDSSLSNFLITEKLIKENYMGEYNPDANSDIALHSYVASLGDEYSQYLNSSEYEGFENGLSGKYQGIGITVHGKGDKILITQVKENSPAQKAGIQAGDYLHKVSGEIYTASTLADAVNAIKGVKIGESVLITVIREGAELNLTVDVEEIQEIYVSSEMLDDSIGYVRIETFGNKIEQDFSACLKNLKEDGMKGLILDLRSNPGGALTSAVNVCDLLMDEGEILTVRDKKGNEDIYKSKKGSLNLPICILINEESASASEVVAGALKDNGKAALVGKKTYGKGVVQSVYKLQKGCGLRITTAKYFTPSGVCIDGVGINPDIDVNLPSGLSFADLEEFPDEDTQLAAAIEYLERKKSNS